MQNNLFSFQNSCRTHLRSHLECRNSVRNLKEGTILMFVQCRNKKNNNFCINGYKLLCKCCIIMPSIHYLPPPVEIEWCFFKHAAFHTFAIHVFVGISYQTPKRDICRIKMLESYQNYTNIYKENSSQCCVLGTV